MKRIFVGIIFVLLVTGVLALAFDVKPVRASGAIYIRADGSIDPPDAPLSTVDDVTYTLTGNITSDADGIVVERNHILIEGSGYTLQGGWNYNGIDLTGVRNVTVRNLQSVSAGTSIYLLASSGNSISGNNITGGGHQGIYLLASSGNSISGNNITSGNGGVYLSQSGNNIISQNNMTDNYGIMLDSSSNNYISGNVFVGGGLRVYYSYGSVVVDNWVNGKPLVYLDGVSDVVVEDAGQVVLVNCAHMRVENLSLNATIGLQLLGTNNTTISGNSITNNWGGIMLDLSSGNSIVGDDIAANNWDGIYLGSSSNNSIVGNNITANREYGIWVRSASGNSITGNNITANDMDGIRLELANNNSIVGNNVANNEYGIQLGSSSYNSAYHNNFVHNTQQFYSYRSTNFWDDGYPSGGNYWSGYQGNDSFIGPYQNVTGSDGIGDAPYIVDAVSSDRYPLMIPWRNLVGDLNKDGKVDLKDIAMVARAFGSIPGSSRWNALADLNGDQKIDVRDIVQVAKHFGKS